MPAETTENLDQLLRRESALRRVATLVAQGAGPERLFEAIAAEASLIIGVDAISLIRWDAGTRTFTLSAATHGPRAALAAGGQSTLDTSPLGRLIVQTGRPGRVDDWTHFPGPVAARHRAEGFGQATGAPIVVNGSIWGYIAAFGEAGETLPPGCETQLADFTQLMATAIANAQAHDDLRDLAESQGALRRVATLVAQGAEPATVFSAVAVEAARMLKVGAVSLIRYDAETGMLTKIFGTHGQRAAVPDGGQWTLPDGPEAAMIVRTGRPVRIDDWTALPGPVAARHVAQGFGQAVAAPIVIDGALWGLVSAFGEAGELLPPGSETRLADFTNLMASAISNAQARDELRGLAEQQGAALRRVATLVAQQATPDAIFTAVAGEASRALRVERVVVARASGGSVTLLGSTASPALAAGDLFARGAPGVVAEVIGTRRPARVDDWTDLPGPVAEIARHEGFGSVVGAPILVGGALWGVIVVIGGESLPADTETRLTDFTHLVASSISNVQAREDLRSLADEQGALRRVATLVAQGAEPGMVFAAVAAEAAGVLGVNAVSLLRYDPATEMFTKVYGTHGDRSAVPDGTRAELIDCPDGIVIVRTGQPVRIDDWTQVPGPVAARHCELGYGPSVAAPIVVDGAIWGFLGAYAETGEILPAGCELRLASFTHLVASSISNAYARNSLIASRARIVTASDETRRRIERNLHDGIQQRVVALALGLRAVRAGAALPPEVEAGLDEVTRDLEGVVEEIRVFSRGLHPALLSRSGLGPSLRALARRSPVPVSIDAARVGRLPEPTETAVYYVVSEALANAAKHSRATEVTVTVVSDATGVRATIADDGVGGAAPARGSGLIGLVDRVEALGGRLTLESPPGRGTTISIELPGAGR
jgi:signal transduction histidine kinase